MTRQAPAVTISTPVLLPSGKWSIDVYASDQPTLTHKRTGNTAGEAASKGREFIHRHLCGFYRSLAADHARRAGRIRQARKAAVHLKNMADA